MSSLGVYFGTKSINIIETKGKKIVNNIVIPQISTIGDDLETKSFYEDKSVEIIASFKEALRRNGINAKEVNLALSGRDLLIRTFEIPELPREELQGAINFEVKKYIPFKIEELNTDFQLESSKGEKTKFVLFAGIKKETLDRYLRLFNQLSIKIKGIEYSAISLLRVVKLAGLPQSGVVATLFADSKVEDENNFLVCENGFPLFTRDITLLGIPEGLPALPAEESSALFLEKLKSEIRVSLDYYNRKFPTKEIKKIHVISSQAHFLDLQAFLAESGLTAKFVDTAKLLASPEEFTAGTIKGYSAALFKSIKTKVNIDLIKLKARAGAKRAQSSLEGLKNLKFDFTSINVNYRIVFLAIIICAGAYAYGFLNNAPLNQELGKIVASRVQVASVKSDASLEEITKIDSEYKRKLDILDSLIKKQLYLTEPLNVIPRAVPDGVWLTKFSFTQSENEPGKFVLNGMASLSDSNKEFDAVNKFLTDLRNDPDFFKYFSDLSISSMDRIDTPDGFETRFTIICRGYTGKKENN